MVKVYTGFEGFYQFGTVNEVNGLSDFPVPSDDVHVLKIMTLSIKDWL